MKYRKEIDGLRAVAVTAVILFHAGLSSLSGGFVGVDIFLVISGYLITSIILDEKQRGQFSLAAFYERRARRILPALFVVLAATIPFALLWMLPREMQDFSQSLIGVVLFASNIVFWQQTGYFDTGVDLKPLIHTWSLAVEEQYYVLFPLLILLGWRCGKRRIGVALATIAGCSLLAAQVFSTTHPQATFFLLHARAWEFIVGALAALYLAQDGRPAINATVCQLLSIAGLALIVAAIVLFNQQTPFPSVYALAPTVGAAFIILCAGPATLVGKLLSLRLLSGVGMISYSAYLWHQPLFAFARTRYAVTPGSTALLGLALATLALAYLTWRLIERPFRQQSIVSRTQVVYAGALVATMLLGVGVVGSQTDGSFFRYDPKAMEVLGSAEERGKYVWKNAERLYLHDFATAGRKVLIIGDSMGADLLNVVHETDLANTTSLAFYTIDYPCGNLYLQESFIDKIAPEHRQLCINRNWYANARLKHLMAQADQVWLASAWTPWQIALLDKSLHNLRDEFGDKFFVFSRKSFGEVDLKRLSTLTLSERRAYRSAPLPFILEINEQLLAAVKGHHYYDLGALACEGNVCRNFSEPGELLSHDGSHLTAAGARYLGQRLRRNARFASDVVQATDGVPAPLEAGKNGAAK